MVADWLNPITSVVLGAVFLLYIYRVVTFEVSRL